MKKRRFTGLFLALMFGVMSVVTGCSLVETNWAKYYNATVSTITAKDGHVIKIYKKDLITAYNTYGYYYEQYYGNSKEEAVRKTLEQLETNKLTVHAAEEKYKKDDEVLTDEEKSYLWHQTNDALQNNLMIYVNQVVGNAASSNNNNADTSETVVSRFSYDKKVTLNKYNQLENKVEINEIFNKEEYKDGKDIKTKEDKELIYDNLVALVESVDGTVYTKAFTEYKKALETSEKGLGYKDNKITDLFSREIDRIYNIYYENYLTTKYTEDLRKENSSEVSTITTEDILEFYRGKVMSSYARYEIEQDPDYENDVLSGLGNIYYFKEGQGATEFYTVSHILIKFTDEQSAKLEDYKTQLTNGEIVASEYNELVDDLYDSLAPIVRYENEDGVFEEDSSKTKQTYETKIYGDDGFYSHVKTQIANAQTDEEKGEAFLELIYKYNQDPGIINAEYNYVMGVNRYEVSSASSSDIITLSDGRKYKKYSQMVDEFTLAGAELYNDGYGKVGALSQPIRTTNGIHILMYTGACKNLFNSIVETSEGKEVLLSNGAIETLGSKRLNICLDKTILDDLYDELYVDNFATFQNGQLSGLRQGCQFKRDEKNLKDMWKD